MKIYLKKAVYFKIQIFNKKFLIKHQAYQKFDNN